MRQEAFERLRQEWREDLPAIIAGIDAREYPEGWALNYPIDAEPMRQAQPISMAGVLSVVAAVTGYTAEEITGPRRYRSLVNARHLAADMLWRVCKKRAPKELAGFLNLHHTTFGYAIRSLPRIMADNAAVAQWHAQCLQHFGIKA